MLYENIDRRRRDCRLWEFGRYDTELGFFHRDNGEYGECPANGSLAASQSETGFAIYGYSFVGWFRFRDLWSDRGGDSDYFYDSVRPVCDWCV